MKIFQMIASLVTIFTPILPVLAETSVAVEGKIIAVTTREPIGAFTVKAYLAKTAADTNTPVSKTDVPLAQTLTLSDGTYSLPIAMKHKTVLLRFEKLSYYSVPAQETVQLASPKTTVSDVAAIKYTYGKTVSLRDLLDAFALREASFNAKASNMSPAERENARKKSLQLDLDSLRKSGVDTSMILTVKKHVLDQ